MWHSHHHGPWPGHHHPHKGHKGPHYGARGKPHPHKGSHAPRPGERHPRGARPSWTDSFSTEGRPDLMRERKNVNEAPPYSTVVRPDITSRHIPTVAAIVSPGAGKLGEWASTTKPFL
jgi:hypothetical protein